jgi:hypothetical protein
MASVKFGPKVPEAPKPVHTLESINAEIAALVADTKHGLIENPTKYSPKGVLPTMVSTLYASDLQAHKLTASVLNLIITNKVSVVYMSRKAMQASIDADTNIDPKFRTQAFVQKGVYSILDQRLRLGSFTKAGKSMKFVLNEKGKVLLGV